MWCGSIASWSGSRSSLRTAADSLTDRVGEDRAERRSRDEQCGDRPLVDHLDQHNPDDAADTERPKCVSDSAEPSLRTAVMLSERPETLRARCHSEGYFTPWASLNRATSGR